MTGTSTAQPQAGRPSWYRSVNTPPFTRAVVFAMAVVAVCVALSLSLPWYKAEVRTDDGYYWNDYDVIFYFEYSVSDGTHLLEYSDVEYMGDLMATAQLLIYAWIVSALIYIGACLLDGRYSSTVMGFVLIGVSTVCLVLVAAYIGDSARASRAWIESYDAEILGVPGSGYVLALFAFVLQTWAILMRAWYVLPWIVDDIRINARGS